MNEDTEYRAAQLSAENNAPAYVIIRANGDTLVTLDRHKEQDDDRAIYQVTA